MKTAKTENGANPSGSGKSAKRILLIDAHPAGDSLCKGFADEYEAGARAAGRKIDRLNLRDLRFDLNFRGYGRGTQELEPDLQLAQSKILASDHIVWVYPVWWGAWPALLKGFIDRVLMPGYAFRGIGKYKYEKLLSGRTARIIATMDSPGWYYRLQGRPGMIALRDHTLKFCGIDQVAMQAFGPVKYVSPERREQWKLKVRGLGSAAA
ncbi:MAG: NAD(P)H-dependent oxidoreductase [Leptospirales bacterium]|jgi:NAD(P)H dehydrogenase (quinone)